MEMSKRGPEGAPESQNCFVDTRFEEKLQEAGRDLEVVIRGHRDVPYRYVEPIMLSCVRAGIWNVTFAVYRPGDHR